MFYSLLYNELEKWVKEKAQPGDVAYHYDSLNKRHYLYNYKDTDANPKWMHMSTDVINCYFAEINKYIDESARRRCENCVHYRTVPGQYSVCMHKDHIGVIVPGFASCPECEPKKPGPLDNVKFFLKDQATGEMELKYVCEDCGKVMDAPFHWWKVETPVPTKAFGKPGYHWRCEECDKKKEGKI